MVITDREKRVDLVGGVINRLDYYRGEVDREQEMKGRSTFEWKKQYPLQIVQIQL